MADFSEQQLAEITQAVARDIREFGQVTAATADRLRDASVGIDGFSRSVRTAKDQVGNAMGDFAQSAYRGAGSMDEYNSTVKQLSNASATLLSMFGPLGIAAAGLVKVFGTLYSLSTEQMTRNYDSFKKLNQAGLFLGAELNDITQSGKAFGMNVAANAEQQRTFIDVLSRNSKTLAQYGGTTDKGRKNLEALAIAMERERKGLMALGYGFDEVMEGQANYIRLQTEAGNKVTGTADDQAKAASRYLRELRGLAEITGESVKEQQAAREELLSNQAFQAKIDEMRAAGQDKEADNLVATYTILRSQSKEMGKGFADIATGNLRTADAQKLQLSTQGQALKASQDLANGTATAGQAINAIATGADQQAKNIRGYVKATGNETGTFNNYVDMKRVALLKDRNLDKEISDVQAKELKTRKDFLAGTAQGQEQLQTAIDQEVTGRREGIRAAETVDTTLSGATMAIVNAMNNLKTAINDLVEFIRDRIPGMSSRLRAAEQRAAAGRPASGGSAAPMNAQPTAAPTGGAAPAAGQMNQLEGLNVKGGAYMANAPLDAKVIEAARAIQQSYPGVRFTSFNDPVKGRSANNAHSRGRAMDIVVSPDQFASLKDTLTSLGAVKVVDETKAPSNAKAAASWAPHIHAEFANGGIARGPRTGFPALLHGTEAVVPLPDGKSIPVRNDGSAEMVNAIKDLKTSISTSPTFASKDVVLLLQDILSSQRTTTDTLAKILQNARA